MDELLTLKMRVPYAARGLVCPAGGTIDLPANEARELALQGYATIVGPAEASAPTASGEGLGVAQAFVKRSLGDTLAVVLRDLLDDPADADALAECGIVTAADFRAAQRPRSVARETWERVAASVAGYLEALEENQ